MVLTQAGGKRLNGEDRGAYGWVEYCMVRYFWYLAVILCCYLWTTLSPLLLKKAACNALRWFKLLALAKYNNLI